MIQIRTNYGGSRRLVLATYAHQTSRWKVGAYEWGDRAMAPSPRTVRIIRGAGHQWLEAEGWPTPDNALCKAPFSSHHDYFTGWRDGDVCAVCERIAAEIRPNLTTRKPRG